MSISSQRFARLLKQALNTIKAREDKNLEIIQDELGHALGRKNGSAVRYWRKGHIPADPEDVYLLSQALAARGGLTQHQVEQFLRCTDYPNAAQVAAQICEHEKDVVQERSVLLELQPFVVGPPITDPRQFYGRSRELERIFNNWQGVPLQNIALVGPRRSGKTSLLHYVRHITTTPTHRLRDGQRADWLKEPQQYRWAVVDFQDPRLVKPQFLLPHLLRELGFPVPTPCIIETFMEVMIDHLERPTIILMDELAAALAAPELDMAFWYSLRALVNSYANGRLAFLLTSHTPPFEIAADVGKRSPFFNMFNLVELGPFAMDEARELTNSSPLPFATEDVEWIIKHSGSWPVLVQLFCNERLLSLEKGQSDDSWQQAALHHAKPYAYLLE